MSFDDVNKYACSMERLDFDRLIQKNMTHAQYIELKKTEKYLMKLLQAVGAQKVTEQEKKQIAAIVKKQNQDIWDLLLAGCIGDAIDVFPALSTEQRFKYAWNRAETLMLSELYSPPHFTKFGTCRQCGPILLPENAIDIDLIQCPWCSVGMLSNFSKGEEKYEQ